MTLIKTWRQNSALRISLIYLAVAGIWILSSDWLLQLLIPEGEMLSRLQTFKGSAFVLATTVMLYVLVRNVRLQHKDGNSPLPPTRRWIPLLVFALVFFSIGISGWMVFSELRRTTTQEIHDNLASVARLKTGQIERWLGERRADARVLADNSLFAREVSRLSEGSESVRKQRKKYVHERLTSYLRHYRYRSITLFDLDGKPQMHEGPVNSDALEHREEALDVIRSRQASLVDFHLYDTPQGKVSALGMLIPVLVDGSAVAAVYIGIDPEEFLFPLLESWPVPSQTAETLLVRREGDRVRFLSRIRLVQAEPLEVSRPLDSPALAAARLLRGENGILEDARDYLNTPVLAYGTPIPGTPWHLVAKINNEEAYAPLHRLTVVTGLLCLVLIVISGSVVWLWWQREQSRHFAELAASRLTQHELRQHYDFLSRHANDIIIITDESGCFAEVNERALQSFGYSRKELLGQTLGKLRTEKPAQYLLTSQTDDDPTGLIFEAEHKRRDGTTFPAEVSARIIDEGGHQYCHMVIRDISERRAAEQALAESAQKFQRLLDWAPVAVGYVDAGGRITYINRRHIGLFGYTLEDIPDIECWTKRAYPDPDYRQKVSAAWDADVARAVETQHDVEPREYEITCKDGSVRIVEISGIPFENGLLATFVDRTAHKQDEVRIQRLTQSYATLSRINETIVAIGSVEDNETDQEQRLFELICQIAVKEGGMKMAWIGRLNPASGLIEPVACHGDGTRYLEEILISSRADVPEGRGPTGTALRENRACFVQDFAHDPMTQRWHHHALKYHWGASAAVPIQRGGKPYAVLNLYHTQSGAFDADIARLLQEISGDVAFALNEMDGRAERKQIQQKLETASVVVVNSRAILWRWKAAEDWPVEYVSENVSQLGYSADDFLSGRVAYSNLIHPEDIDRVSAEVAAQSAAGRVRFIQEYRLICRDGRLRWVSDDTVVLRDEAGNITHYQGVTSDITDRVEAQRALSSQEQRFRAYFERSMVGMATASPEKGWIEVNPALCELLGYTREELLTKTWEELTYPDDLPNDLAQFKRILDGEIDEYSLNKRFVRSDGRVVDTHLATRAVRREDGSIDYFVALIEDITEAKRAQQVLLENERQLSTLMSNLPGMAFSCKNDPDWTMQFVSPGCAMLTGYAPEDLIDNQLISYNALIVEEDRQQVWDQVQAALESRSQYRIEYRIRRRDGTIRHVWEQGVGVWDAEGGLLAIEGLAIDMSDKKLAEAMVQKTMEKLELDAEVFRHSREGIIITDRDNRILSVNPAFCVISGYGEEEVVGQNPGLLKSGRQDEDFYQEMWQSLREKGHWQGEVWNRRKNGEIYPERLSISTVTDSEGNITHHIGILADISEYKAAQEKIQHLAHFDSLTGLPNRTLLRDRAHVALAAAQRSQRQLALCFLDLDHFKNINDSLGHQLGDALLEQVAKRLIAGLREQDTVARIGGDEFVLLLTEADTTGVAHVAEKLLQEVAQPYHIENYEFSITLSIGIAMYPDNGEDFDTLARCADSALYRAKQGGRNNFCFFTAEMHQSAQRVLEMETALHRALERHQLSLNYQPQIDIRSGHMIGCEALLRWRHPEFGQVSPAEFVPIAEDSGLILQIGSWVIREAVAQIKTWQKEGLPLLPVAVNLSAAQFKQPHLGEMIMQILSEAGLPPAYLELELTESITMNDPLVVIGILDELHHRGFKLSIDDFGTGYSSLSYLKRFNIDKLKIDQSFVRDIATDPEDAAIVTAIIHLAHNLGLSTIAEGVETVDQLNFLRENGCDEVQGYYYSRPLTAQDFAELLRKEQEQSPKG